MEKVVVVTGASGGLGSEIAYQFAVDGGRVVVNYNRSEEEARTTAERIAQTPGQALLFKADVRNYQEVKAMADAALNKWGRIDVLVNNAGAFPTGTSFPSALRPEGSPVMEMSEEEWDWLIDTNLKGSFLCIKAVAPCMVSQKEGHIVNVGSSHAITGRPGRAGYSAAKAGLIALAKCVAWELGPHNIKVNTVMPGPIPHPRRSATTLPGVAQRGVLRRGQTKEEFARFIVELTSLENVSAQLFNLDNTVLF